MHAVFLCGPFADPRLLARIEGGQGTGITAILPDHALFLAENELVPSIMGQAGSVVEGVIVHLEAAALRQLATLQAAFGAHPVPCKPKVKDAFVSALTYLSRSAPTHAPVPMPTWSATRTAVITAALCELADLAATHPAAALRARWQMALSHAASVLRAQTDPEPSTQRGGRGQADVVLRRRQQPYAWFFGVREDDLQFRRFDGGLSPEVKRAAFVMSDAVTVLPYDPRRERVMLVEQFRYGPWLRGASNPWSLEPIAGRIDPFETPQDAALREAQEEAQLTLRADGLKSVGNAYPSPGAVTEFLYHFVALCDLPDDAEGVAGLETEAEDIRSHVISFDRLVELVTSGEVQNGPLVLTTWWLAAHRGQLQE